MGDYRYTSSRLILIFDRYRATDGRVAFTAGPSTNKLFLAGPCASGKSNWPVGTWKETGASNSICLHVVEVQPGSYFGWSDSLHTWGKTLFAPGLQNPPYALEHYGELMKVNALTGNATVFELFAYAATCCSHRFAGEPSRDGRSMRTNWAAASSDRSFFQKRRGGRCSSSRY